jgi:hypothetical protein
MATARWFDEAKYDGSQPRGGVPLRDIPEQEWETFPEHIQVSADALPYFKKSNPHPTPRKPAEKDEEATP